MTVEWVSRVNEELEGRIKVTLGGPETIPGMQQPDAVRSGVVDIIF
jgi:TRAP-type transport system periplasmic protein